MKKAENPARWYTPWRAESAADEDDAADMGTAFGLDMSISDEQADAARQDARMKSTPGIVARWATRRKSAL